MIFYSCCCLTVGLLCVCVYVCEESNLLCFMLWLSFFHREHGGHWAVQNATLDLINSNGYWITKKRNKTKCRRRYLPGFLCLSAVGLTGHSDGLLSLLSNVAQAACRGMVQMKMYRVSVAQQIANVTANIFSQSQSNLWFVVSTCLRFQEGNVLRNSYWRLLAPFFYFFSTGTKNLHTHTHTRCLDFVGVCAALIDVVQWVFLSDGI